MLLGLNGLTEAEFLQAVEKHLGKVTEYEGEGVCRPDCLHSVGLYVGKKWYRVHFHNAVCEAEKSSERLDCAILQKCLFQPVLGISDPRTDKRIDFVGGIRGLQYLQDNCEKDGVAFSMFPTSMAELTAVADAGELMPPKSTWFEPKLRSGIFIHKI